MPHEYVSWLAHVLCNDCVKRSVVKYHFLGHECAHCQGFNTSVMKIDKRPPAYVPATAADAETTQGSRPPAQSLVEEIRRSVERRTRAEIARRSQHSQPTDGGTSTGRTSARSATQPTDDVDGEAMLP